MHRRCRLAPYLSLVLLFLNGDGGFAFDVNTFNACHCRAVDELTLLCKNIKINEHQQMEIQTQNFVISEMRRIHIDHSDLGLVNANFFTKFPRAEEIEITRSTFALNSSVYEVNPVVRLPLRSLRFRRCAVHWNANTNALKALPMLQNFQNFQPRNITNRSLDKSFFQGNPQLTSINLNGCLLGRIDEEAFARQHHLQEIILTYNNLTVLNVNMFRHNPKLERVNLKGNGLRVLPPRSMFPATLKSLHLNNNRLEAITKNHFQGLHLLSFLHLGYNDIKIISDKAFQDLRDLEHLNLYHNMLTGITQQHFQANIKLKTLHIQGNRITAHEHNLLDDLINLENFGL